MRIGLLYHSGALGDLIVAIPAVEYWTTAEHLDRIVLAGRGPHGELLRACGIVNDRWNTEARHFACAYLGVPPVLSERVSTALAFTQPGGPIEHALSLTVSGPVRVVRPVPEERQSIVQHHLRAVGADAKQAMSNSPELRLSTTDVHTGDPRVAIAPGSGSSRKNWPLDRFAAVASTLREQATIVWFLGPAEKELRPPTEPADLILRDQPIVATAEALSVCSLLLGNDSGITHMAAALSVPVVALFATSDPKVWAPCPAAAPVTVVTPNTTLPAANCQKLPAPATGISIQQITTNSVLRACLRLLDR